MSGIVGIVHFDGAPVDRALLTRMTGFMTFHGPDAQADLISQLADFHELFAGGTPTGSNGGPKGVLINTCFSSKMGRAQE